MKQNLLKKFLICVLILGLLFPDFANIVVNAVPNSTTFEADRENTEDLNTDIAKPTKEVSVTDLTQDTQILTHIDETVLTANKHVARLTEEETLSSYVFLNSDGTKTVYYMDKEVKFLDKDGKTVEKNISLTNTLNGFTTVSNDIGLHLPNDPADGIRLSYNGYDIIIVPEGGSLSKTAQSNDTSVIYPDYFGSEVSLMYTPSLDGLKEDIVLTSYTGVTTFSFRLFTDGLCLYQENNRYYLASPESAEMQIDMGDVVAFDARGRFSVGTAAVTTVALGQEYLLTLSVDESFLTDETTTYPVSIDPTLTVSDNTHGAGAIEDITIYSGTPNANCDWSYLHCGYYNSTYKIARTMFRLTGLLSSSEYQAASAATITSAEFHIQEATGTAALPVHIYSNTGNSGWTETGATWNNSGHALGTVYATVSPGVNQAVSYNITNLVKAWKNNTESAQAGFILVSSNETSLDKAFYSSETAYTAYRSYVVVNYEVGNNFSSAVVINADHIFPVDIATAGVPKYFKFTPSATGFYTIESSNHTGDPKVWLYNFNQVELASDDDSGATQDYNFGLTYHFIANVTYYIAAGHYGAQTGSYNIVISSTPSVNMPGCLSATAGTGYTVNITSAYAVQYYMLKVAYSGFYYLQSSLDVGDAMIWVYDTDLSCMSIDNDSGGNKRFRVKVYLAANKAYYLAVGHNGALTGSYGFTVLMPVTVPNGVKHLQNAGTDLYLDLPSPDAPQYAYQSSVHKIDSARWSIQQQSDGYYTIQSQFEQMHYLGISNTSVNVDNVVMRSTISDYTLWSIYGTADGMLLIEPKMSMGTVLYVPNTSAGTYLQLGWMSSAVASRNKWELGVRWNIALEGQQMEKWCWAAAARMLASNYTTIPDARTQSEAVLAVKGSVINEGGTLTEAIQAANYYGSGSIDDSTPSYTKHSKVILQEAVLRQFLEDGHCVYVSRGWYDENNTRSGGHAYAIVGYFTIAEAGSLKYKYIVRDPDPIVQPQNWDTTATPTTGQTRQRSYAWICNGRNHQEDEPGDIGIWTGFVVVKTDYSDYVIPPVWNE